MNDAVHQISVPDFGSGASVRGMAERQLGPTRTDDRQVVPTRSYTRSVERSIGASVPDGFSPNTFNFATPQPDMVNSGMGNYFEALRVSKDRSNIPFAMVHLRPQILRLINGLNRKMLAAVGRYLVDNGGVPSYAVNTIANYSCPVRPHSMCGDPVAGKVLEDYFSEWSKRCDWTRRFNFDELQTLACKAIDTDGDIGAVITEKGAGFPQVRFFDTFHIGTLTGMDPKDGVVVDDYGILKGYNVVDGPIETLQGITNRFVSADQLLLLRDAERYDNYRGFTPMRHGSNDIRDQGDIKALLKLQEKIRAALAGFIKSNGPLEEDVWGDTTGPNGEIVNQAGEDNPIPQEKKLSLWEMLGGDVPVMDGELQQFDTKLSGAGGIEFMAFLAGQFVAGLGLPPAFFLDEKLTGPNVRAVLGKVQRKFDKRKQVLAKFVEFCWLRVMAWGIQKGEIPATPGWWKIAFQFPPIITIDLGDVMNNERQDVLCGQMTERERLGNRGRDFDRDHAETVNELRSKLKSAVELHGEVKDAGVPIGPILSRLGFGAAQGMSIGLKENDPGAGGDEEDGKDEKKDEKKKEQKK